MNQREIFVTTSIGVSLSSADGQDEDALVRRSADALMYRAREEGRDTFPVCSPGMSIRSVVSGSAGHSPTGADDG
jgi:PleD family two-component response regulator